MQIIYAHTVNIASHAPAVNYVFNNVLALAKKGITVHLLITNSQDTSPSKLIERHFNRKIPDNLHIHAFDRNKGKFNFLFYFSAIRKIKQLKTNDTILITRATGLLPYLFLFTRLGHKMHVFFEFHGFFYKYKFREKHHRKSTHKKKSLYEKLFLKYTRGLICLDNSNKKLYAQYFPEERISVFERGLSEIVRNSGVRKKQVVYVGSLDDNVYAITDIIKTAAVCDPSITFIIIGGKTSAQINKFQNLAREYKVQNQVKIISWITQNELSSVLSQSKVGLLALRNTFGNQNNTHLKLFDYFAHGLPVIVPGYPSYKELVTSGKEGFFLDWENQHREIAHKISEIVDNDDIFSRLSEHVYQKAQSLTWDKRAEKQITYFKEYLSKGDYRKLKNIK